MSRRDRGVDERSPVDAVVHHPRLANLPRSERERVRMNRFAVDLARWLVGRPREQLGPLARVVTVVAQRELRDARRLAKERPLLALEAAARTVEVLWPLLRGPEEPDAPEEEEEPPPGEGDGDGGEGEGDGQGAGEASEDEDGEDAESGGAAGAGGGAGPPPEEGADEDDAEDAEGDGSEAEGDAKDADPDEADGEDADGEDDGDDADGEDGPLDPLDVLEALAEMGPVADPELDALAQRLRESMAAGDGSVEIASAAGEMLEEAGQAAAQGAIDTDRAARHLERFLPGIGWSHAPGALETSLIDQLDGLVTLLERLADLQELADALGRMEEPTKAKGFIQGGREEVVGVHLGGEVANALPSELALLADPDTEDLFYQRYIEHRLISLELTGSGDQGSAAGDKRGPVIACIDTSGSMEGPPEMAAKALVLAVCRRVLPRNRAVHLILFGGPGERTEIRLKRGRGGLENLLTFLLMSFHSGTDFDGPLLRAMDLLEEQELLRADVLVVTDGLCRASREVIERVVSVRDATGARVWSVVLGRADPRGVEPFSHRVLTLDPRGAAEASGLLEGLEGGTRSRWIR
ncbi:MAG: VWA domain-containing protein [Myxococcota bacterium]